MYNIRLPFYSQTFCEISNIDSCANLINMRIRLFPLRNEGFLHVMRSPNPCLMKCVRIGDCSTTAPIECSRSSANSIEDLARCLNEDRRKQVFHRFLFNLLLWLFSKGDILIGSFNDNCKCNIFLFHRKLYNIRLPFYSQTLPILC